MSHDLENEILQQITSDFALFWGKTKRLQAYDEKEAHRLFDLLVQLSREQKNVPQIDKNLLAAVFRAKFALEAEYEQMRGDGPKAIAMADKFGRAVLLLLNNEIVS